MDTVLIGLRAQDFHESLKTTAVFGPKEVQFRNTLLIGKAASLAMHLRGLLYIEDYSQLEYAAASLGIGSIELPAVLHELEAVDFVSVARRGEKVKRVDIKVPEFRSGYAELGQRWLDLKPGEVERAGVVTLEDLHHSPTPMASLQKSLGLNRPYFAQLRDVMMSGQLLASQPIDGTPMAYTPLAVDGNPSLYLNWANRFPGEVQSVVSVLTSRQGLAISDPAVVANPALSDAISTGVLMPVEVNGATGAQRFVFAPRGGLQEAERTILDKARAIVSCVRYGQSFAEGRPIRYPRRILEILQDRKQFSRGHPDLFSQYGLLTEKLIGTPIDEGAGRWNFRIHDTEENMQALQVAVEMIEHGESPSARVDPDAQRALSSPTAYLGPASTRPRMASDPVVSEESRSQIIKEIANLARGIDTNG